MEYAGWSVASAAQALRGTDRVSSSPVDVQAIARRQRADVVSAGLAATTGGQDALLVPRAGGGFRVVIDPRLGPDERAEADYWGDRAELARAVRRWRLAHELAHTLFYRPGRPPRRRRPWAPAEEVFCDAVADELLAPRAIVVVRPDRTAAVMALELGAPIAALRRSAGASAGSAERESLPA